MWFPNLLTYDKPRWVAKQWKVINQPFELIVFGLFVWFLVGKSLLFFSFLLFFFFFLHFILQHKKIFI